MRCKIPARRDVVGGLFVQGCLGCAIPYGLIAIAQQSVDSALAAILNSPTPIFVFLISLAWTRHEPLTAGRIFGVTTGLGGVVLIAGANALLGLGEAAAGQTAIIVATISSAVGAIYSRRFAAVAPQVTAAGALTCAAVVLGPLCFLVEAPLQSAPSAAAIAALLANAVLATALGFVYILFDPHDRQHGRGKRQLSQACRWRADRLYIAGRDAHLDGSPRPYRDPDRRRRDQSELRPNATDIGWRC